MGEICPIAEILHRPVEAQDLHTVADSALIHLHLPFEQAIEHLRISMLIVDDLVFLIIADGKILGDDAFLLRLESTSHLRHVLGDYLVKCGFLYHGGLKNL